MKSQKTKLKILAVGPIQTSATVKRTDRKVVLTVAEIPADNPYGHTRESSAPFDVEVHNHNIEAFNINTSLVDEIASAELCITFYKRDANTPTTNRFLVNSLVFEI